MQLSDNEGKSWIIKKLALAPEHNDWHGVLKKGRKPQHGFGTVGYCAATQSSDDYTSYDLKENLLCILP